MVSEKKVRIAISLTKEQAETMSKIAEELGVTKSNFIQLATMQYIQAYRATKGISADIGKLADQVKKTLEEISKNE